MIIRYFYYFVCMKQFDLGYLENLQSILDRLISQKEQLDRARPLPTSALTKLKESLAIEWTYNSNAIEGNTITLRETQLVLQEGITIKGKSLREHFEVFNHNKALGFLYQMAEKDQPLTVSDILSLHGLVLRSIEDDYAGRIRTGSVRISGADFIPPNARKVPELMDELVEFVNQNPMNLPIILLSAIFHHQFVWIHPFFDGNGRAVRLAMNLLLMRQGYPPAIILKNDRTKYYNALNHANKGDYQKLTLLIAQSLERSLNLYLNSLPSNPDEDYLPISDIAREPDIPYGQEYISLLARRGLINAHKEGRNWVTSKKAVLRYAGR